MVHTIKTVLSDCQTGHHNQTTLVKRLTQIYNSMDMDEFFDEFIHLVKYFLIVFKREPAVERAIDFISKFGTSLQASSGTKEKDVDASPGSNEDVEMHPFLLKLFNFLLQNHKANDKAVRFRCCHLVNKLLCDLGEEAIIDDDLYNKIYDCMLIRLRDKFAIVRAHAVLALSRLQNPADRDCPVIKAYLFMLGCDQNFAVRRAVLSSVAASARTLSSVLERTRDVEASVRRLAYQVIAEKVHIRALTIAQRVKLLHQGLNDRTDSVREACSSKLLQAWLRTFSGNAIELLNCLDVENSMDTCQLMLQVLFKKASPAELASGLDILTDDICIPLEKLTCENAFYWRCLCEYIQSLGTTEEEHLDKILPNGVVFARYLRDVTSHMKTQKNLETQLKNDFILQQLLGLVTILDLSDIVARKSMDQLMKDLLLDDSISHSLVKSLLIPYLQLRTDYDPCVTSVAEIISDIREPMTVTESQISREEQRQLDLKLASVRVELNQLRDELDDSVHRQDFARAAEIKDQIASLETTRQSLLDQSAPKKTEVRVEKSDSRTLVICLTILTETLSYLKLGQLNSTLQSLLESLVIPGIQNTDPAVRNLALRALGLCCLRSLEKARDYLLLLLQVSKIDVEVVQVTAIMIIFDMLHFFGLKEFNIEPELSEKPSLHCDPKDDDSTLNASSEDFDEATSTRKDTDRSDKAEVGVSVLTILSDFLDSDSSEVRTTCAEGFARLMLAGRIISPTLFSRLLLHWYNPLTEDDTRLRQCLGTFFPIYAFASRVYQEVVAEAFMSTLKTLFEAPSTSPLTEIKDIKVAELLVQLTSTRHLTMDRTTASTMMGRCFHDDIAIKIANEILKDPDSDNIPVLVKVLLMLELMETDESILKELKVLGERMLKVVKDKLSSKSLEKFQRTIKDLIHRKKRGDMEEEKDCQEVDAVQADEEEMEGKDDEEEMDEEADIDVNEKENNKDSSMEFEKGRKATTKSKTDTVSMSCGYSLRKRQMPVTKKTSKAYSGSSNEKSFSSPVSSPQVSSISFNLDESTDKSSESDVFQSPVNGKRKTRSQRNKLK